MTDNEAEVLAALVELSKLDENQQEGFRPLDFGGKDASHHAQTAIRMIPKGWVERRFSWLGGGTNWGEAKTVRMRGSCRYRITPKGVVALANHQATSQAASEIRQAHKRRADAVRAKLDARKGVTP